MLEAGARFTPGLAVIGADLIGIGIVYIAGDLAAHAAHKGWPIAVDVLDKSTNRCRCSVFGNSLFAGQLHIYFQQIRVGCHG